VNGSSSRNNFTSQNAERQQVRTAEGEAITMNKRKGRTKSKLLKHFVTEQPQRQKQAGGDDTTPAKKERERRPLNAEIGEELHQRAIAQPYRLFPLHEILTMFNLDDKRMIRYRKLSARDAKSNPWIGDKTRPEKFAEWLWDKRLELEEQDPGT
jgi:hypothetical protein